MVKDKIDSETEQILIGSLLGDGSLQFQKRSINALFREMHSTKQKEYLLWKKEHLLCFHPEVREIETFDNRTKKIYYSVLLWTKTHHVLTKYFNLLYKNNKKKLNTTILDKVGPLALAVWYCDDGSYGYLNQNAKIATYLSYEDNKLLADILKYKFNINCTVNKDGRSYHLYFSVQEIKKFLNLIKDYVPKCMDYKLGSFAEKNIVRLNEENLKRRQKDRLRYQKYMSDPARRELIIKQHKENHKRRMQNPEYRKKYNEHYKNWKKQSRAT